MITSSTNLDSSAAASSQRSGLRATLTVGLFLCLLQLANLFYRVESLPAEVSLRIECAKLILLGQKPYVDFFVLDSPLSLFIATIPVKLAQMLALDPGYATAYCTLFFEWIIATGSLALTATLFLKRKHLASALWCRSFLLTLAILNIVCVYQFGQTEHLLVLALTPYLVARWLEYSGNKLQAWESCLPGAAAGFAIMLDPCFWIACLALEMLLLFHFKKFPLRMITSLSILASTALAVHFATYSFGSLMMQGYHSYILPLLTADRQSFDMHLYGQQSSPDTRIVYYFLTFVTLLAFGIRKRSSIATPLLALGWLGMAYHIAMCKGFFFQALPMFWCSALAISILGTSLLFDLKRLCSRRFEKYVRPLVLVQICAVATICVSLLTEQYLQQLADTAKERDSSPAQHQITDVFSIVLTKSRELDKVIVFSENVTPFYPMATLKKRINGSRIMWSYHLPILTKMKNTGNLKEHDRLWQFYKRILLEDIENNRPPLILSDQTEEVWALFAEKDIEKFMHSHYIREEEAQYYSDNLPPREYANPNYPLWVDSYSH